MVGTVGDVFDNRLAKFQAWRKGNNIAIRKIAAGIGDNIADAFNYKPAEERKFEPKSDEVDKIIQSFREERKINSDNEKKFVNNMLNKLGYVKADKTAEQAQTEAPKQEKPKESQPAQKEEGTTGPVSRWQELVDQQNKTAAKKTEEQKPAAEAPKTQQPVTETPAEIPAVEAPKKPQEQQPEQKTSVATKPAEQKQDGESYTVKKGDNLWNIVEQRLGKEKSKLTGKDIKEIQDGIKQIAKDNGIKDPNLIHPDQKLKINFPVKTEEKAPAQSKQAEQAPVAQPEPKEQNKEKPEAESPSIQI